MENVKGTALALTRYEITSCAYCVVATLPFIIFYIMLVYRGFLPSGAAGGIVFLLVFLCVLAMLAHAAIAGRKYEVSSEGVTAIWIGYFKRLYHWEEFGYVGIATFKFVKMRREKQIVCTIAPLTKTERNLSWFVFRPFSTLYLQFTPERYEVFTKYCPSGKLSIS